MKLIMFIALSIDIVSFDNDKNFLSLFNLFNLKEKVKYIPIIELKALTLM